MKGSRDWRRSDISADRSQADSSSARRRGVAYRVASTVAARYDMGPATCDFGYVPRVSIDEGLARLAETYRADQSRSS